MDWQTLYDRLASTSTEMREVSDEEFMQLKALVPNKIRLRFQDRRFDSLAYENESQAHRWLKSLIRFNELAREAKAAQLHSKASALPSELPDSRETAEQTGFVAANHILAAWSDRFPSHAALSTFLESHPQIRTYKPSGNRKMVHAGDLIRTVASVSNSQFADLDREGAEERAAAIRNRRIDSRK